MDSTKTLKDTVNNTKGTKNIKITLLLEEISSLKELTATMTLMKSTAKHSLIEQWRSVMESTSRSSR